MLNRRQGSNCRRPWKRIPAGYDSRVFVGVCEAARKQGSMSDKLPIEEFVIRTVGRDLYIVGKEMYPEQYHGSRPHYSEPWNPLAMECVHSGTLLGCLRSARGPSGRALAVAGRAGDVCAPARHRRHSRRSTRPSSRGCCIEIWAVGTYRRFF